MIRCSTLALLLLVGSGLAHAAADVVFVGGTIHTLAGGSPSTVEEIGRASCRERVSFTV